MAQTEVDVLSITSPHQISVRPRRWKENYYKFQASLDVFCSETELTSIPPPTLTSDLHCLVRRPSSWQRAVILWVDHDQVPCQVSSIRFSLVIFFNV